MGKQVIDIGVVGWDREDAYFPGDLPHEWRLAYYANEHDSVWVPGEIWLGDTWPDTAAWREDADEVFRFVAVLDERHLALPDPAAIGRALTALGEQLAVVIAPASVYTGLFGSQASVSGVQHVVPDQLWSPGGEVAAGASVGRVEAAVLDSPRAMRAVLEDFAAAGHDGRLFLGVDGPVGAIEDLRTLARLMGLC